METETSKNLFKKHAEKDFNKGGLQMVNIEKSEQTMKIKWLKNKILSKGSWTLIPIEFDMHLIQKYGPDYISSLISKILNPFWGSVLKALKVFRKIVKNDSLPRSQLSHTFTNPFGLIQPLI